MKPQQESHWYKEFQICLYPVEPTIRDDSVWSYLAIVWDKNRCIVMQREWNCDEIFWSGLNDGENTSKKVLAYCISWVDNFPNFYFQGQPV